ncbi:MAG: tetratricopeptide repeat protein [Candidatus Krumholzibacteriota bacterium]
MSRDLQRWQILGLAALAAIVLLIPVYVLRQGRAPAPPTVAGEPTFVGRNECRSCHETEFQSWLNSDHDKAMDVAADSTVLGDFDDAVFSDKGVTSRFFRRDGRFFVHTAGPGGKMGDFEITHTFGHEPLQQYLVPFPGGRFQCLTIAWDTDEGRWFNLYPDTEIPHDDWLSWTGGGQNWNGMCAECHSTDLKKGYDPDTKSFNTTWFEIDVSCEACHGPGSDHVEWARIQPMARPEVEEYGLAVATGDLAVAEFVNLCAPCHARRVILGDYDHADPHLLENMVPTTLDQGLYHADGQILEEVYVYGSFVQSKMFANDVSCRDCHDSHSLKLRFDGNDLCLQCHLSETYDSYDHHFHKKVHEGKPSDGALCVKCHMPEQPYMVIDERADHSLRVPRPDLSLTTGSPNACNTADCHGDKSVAWSVEHYEKWYGLARKPHYGTALAAGREGTPAARDDLIRLAGDMLYPGMVRATALSLLPNYPSPESTAAFARALADEDALVRYTAVNNASAATGQEFVDLLAPLLFDPVGSVRIMAASRLADAPDEMLKPYQQEALAKSLAEYEEAMAYSLDFPFAGFNLGNLYARLGDAGKAEAFYRTAIDIDGLFIPARANLAILLNSLGRNEEAEAQFRAALDAEPEAYDLAYSLGLLLGEMGKYEEAEKYLAIAVAGMPGHPRAAYNLEQVRDYLRDRE